ncbi:MAG: dicarboxylate/amino acid:cation symporter [Bacillota bacterium]|jgi:Na+/H+-dicarboxylate symporter
MKKMGLATKILIGLILGVIVGLFIPLEIADTYLKPIGALFLRLIKMIIVPLVFASLVVGASSVGDVKKLGRMGGKTIAYYLVTTAIAVTIGIALANILQPGAGLVLPVDATYEGKEAPSIVNVILEIFPDNPLQALVSGNMLQLIVFALFIGIAITLVGKRAEPVRVIFEGFAEVMYKITGIIMETAPYGVFGLIAPVVAAHGLDVLLPLLMIIIVVYLGCILHAGIVYSTFVKLLGKMSPITFFKGILPAQLIAFSTCSSAATLPVNIKCTEDNLGVSKEVSSFVLPLGATINMDGSALYQGACAIFVAQVYGLDLSLGQQLTIVLTGTLASIGAAGVPGAGLIMLTMVLASVGLPLDGVALVAGVDRILDMARTTVNITGDASASVIVAASEGDLEVAQPNNLSV